MKLPALLALSLSFFSSLQSSVLQEEGLGYLEDSEGQLILHLKGDDYQRGYQHGKLLKELIEQNVLQFVDTSHPSTEQRKKAYFAKMDEVLSFIPDSIMSELKGLSEGSLIPFEKILVMNLFPEMFHCSAIALKDSLTTDHKLYHVRALDYRMGKGLQRSSVLIVSEPSDGISNLSVSYAGFIGCITGMNQKKISLGEVGGQGYGNWDGLPMAFLMKLVLENASTLSEAKELFEQNARTCEYFYLISDGKDDTAVGVYATPSQIRFIEMGTSYALMAPGTLPSLYEKDGTHDKFFLADYEMKVSDFQTLILGPKNTTLGLFHKQPEDSIVITGYAKPDRYPHLAEAIHERETSFDVEAIKKLINPKTTLDSNLHNAIFLPSELKIWISHASSAGEPAYTQPYKLYDLTKLLTGPQ